MCWRCVSTSPSPPSFSLAGSFPMARIERRSGSQSRIPAILFWILAAAVVFRVATGVRSGKGEAGSEAGLVRWQQLESAAASPGKPVLYDFTAAWSAPCHRLDEEGWADPEIARIVNAGFRPVRVVDRQREDGRNTPSIDELQRHYGVSAFPTLVVVDGSGQPVAKTEGYGGKTRLIAFLEDARRRGTR